MSATEDMASESVNNIYREVPNNDAVHDEYMNYTGKGAMSSSPLARAPSGTVLNIPYAFSTLSVYTNIPGNT